MKNHNIRRTRALVLAALVLTGSIANAAVGDFVLSVRNVTQPTSKTLEFDVYLLDSDPGQPFELSGCQIGLLLNSSIYNGGVLSVAINNAGSGLVPDQQFASVPDVVSSLVGYPGLSLIRLAGNTAPPIPPGAGSGTVISTTGYGTLLTHFIVTSTVDFTPNSTPDLLFTSGSAVSPLYPTEVAEYIDAIDTQLTVTPGVNAIVDGNPVLNATLPMTFNVTGSGSYCAGGTGLTVGLDDSEADVTYTLFRDGLEITTLPGDGDAITFGLRLAGIYTVEGTNITGTVAMNGQAEITVNAPATPVHTFDCSLGFNHAGITVTSPVGAGYQYRLNSGNYQVSPIFTDVVNGSYTITVINSSNCTATGPSFDVSCGCVNGPTVTLGSVSGSTCGTAPLTVINNSFGGSATSVTIIENGAGTVSPAGTVTTPFSFTYTPAAGDIGNTVTITVTTNNPLGVPCAAAFATYSLTVNAIPTITGTTPGSRCGNGVVTLGATATAGTVNWYTASTGGGSIGTGNSFTTPVISATTTYYVDATNNGCTTAGRTPVIATVLQIPSAAGSITGAATYTPGTAGVPYSVASIAGATGYMWSYSGTGVTINGSGTSITLDFATNATSGSLSVYGTNTCGQGSAATLTLSPSIKTLTLTSVLLEGLYNVSGTMRQAQNAGGPQWPAGVADHITVELHNSSNYATIVWSQTEVSLSTAGTAVITVPAIYNGTYYITVKHRNSVETTTNSPVSFAGTVINRVFGSAAGIYGANLKTSGDGYFLVYGGDVNQDGYVDSGDYPDVVNDNFNYITGYLPTDINGDGFIDSGDYPIMVNNNLNYVGTIHP